MIFESPEVGDLISNKIRTQKSPTSLPLSTISRENPMTKNRVERLLSSGRKAEIFELSSKNSFDVLRFRSIDDFLAQKQLTESVHASIDRGVSLLGCQPDASLFGEPDVLLEQIESEDRIFVRILGVRFASVLLDDFGLTLI